MFDFRRLRVAAPLVFLVTALPTVLLLAVLTPPFQIPDEGSHFRRAVHILGGGIVGKRVSETDAGAAISAPAVDIDVPMLPLLGHPERKVDPKIVVRMRAIPWSETRQFQYFPQSLMYPPAFYLPAVAGLALGKMGGLGVVDSATVGRVVNGIAVVVLGTVALAIARRSRALLFVILSLPASLFLAAGITQDGVMLACTALAAALLCRRVDAEERLSPWEQATVSLLLGLVVAARPPYAPLLAIPLLPSVRGRGWRGLMPFLGAAAVAGAWVIVGASPMLVPYGAEQGISKGGQLAYLLENPGATLRVGCATLGAYGSRYYREFIGILGWGDTPLPPASYWLASAALLTALAIASSARDAALSRRQATLVVCAAILSGAAIYGAMYVTWTPVGAPLVDGVQGRYFLPLAAVAAVTAPPLLPIPRSLASERATAAGWMLLFGVALVNGCMASYAVYARFYG